MSKKLPPLPFRGSDSDDLEDYLHRQLNIPPQGNINGLSDDDHVQYPFVAVSGMIVMPQLDDEEVESSFTIDEALAGSIEGL